MKCSTLDRLIRIMVFGMVEKCFVMADYRKKLMGWIDLRLRTVV